MRVSRDKIKRLISDYKASDKHLYKEFLDDLLSAIVDTSLAHGFNIVIEGTPYAPLDVSYKGLADKYKVKYIEVNLEADIEAIKKRFQQRLERAKQENFKLFCTDEETLLGHYQKYLEMRSPDAVTIRTDEITADETIKRIKDLLP